VSNISPLARLVLSDDDAAILLGDAQERDSAEEQRIANRLEFVRSRGVEPHAYAAPTSGTECRFPGCNAEPQYIAHSRELAQYRQLPEIQQPKKTTATVAFEDWWLSVRVDPEHYESCKAAFAAAIKAMTE
jgi:hypothetical protein